jgi:hypothetical protein
MRGLMTRMHKKAAVVALANRLARIAWAVIRHGKTFSMAVSATAYSDRVGRAPLCVDRPSMFAVVRKILRSGRRNGRAVEPE